MSLLDDLRAGMPKPGEREPESDLLRKLRSGPAQPSMPIAAPQAIGAAPPAPSDLLSSLRSGTPQVGGEFRFPPPVPGSIPQDQVLREKKDIVDTVFDPLKNVLSDEGVEVGKAGIRNYAGMAVGPLQAARHPVATAAGVPAKFVGGLMDIAEMALPYVGDEHPIVGHKTVKKVVDWSERKVKEDAPFKEAGDYAAGVSDLLGLIGPLAGVTKIPKVGNALAKVSVPLGATGAKFVGKVTAPIRTALGGRKVLETFPEIAKLETVKIFLKSPALVKKAVKFIDDPTKAPTAGQQILASNLKMARDIDDLRWNELDYTARTYLAEIGDFANSSDPALVNKARLLKSQPFSSQAPPSLAMLAQRGKLQKFYDNYVLRMKDYAFSRPGTRSDLAARYVSEGARKFFKNAVPRAVEASGGEHRALAAQTDHHRLLIVEAIRAEANNDLDEMAKLAKEAMGYYKSLLAHGRKPGLPVLDPNVVGSGAGMSSGLRQVVDDAFTSRKGLLDEMAASGLLDKATLNKLKNPKELFIKVYAAAHDPFYVNEARKSAGWDRVRKVLKKHNPTAPLSEIDGAIERMMDTEMALHFERTGNLRPSLTAKKSGNPLLKNVVGGGANPLLVTTLKKKTGRSALRAAAEELYGPVDDLPSAYALSGEVLARTRARNMLENTLIEDMHKVGLASHKEETGLTNVKKLLGLKRDVWVADEMVPVYEEAENVVKDMHLMVRHLTKMGAAWRAGSTVYSPMTSIQNSLSNMFSISGTGDMYRTEFFPSIMHSIKQGVSAVARGGQARNFRVTEEALARRSLGGGTVSGEFGQILTETGSTPRISRTELTHTPSWMVNMFGAKFANSNLSRKTVGGVRRAAQFARDAFEQGDVVPKRVVSELIAADFDAIAKNGTSNDVQNIMQGIYGSTDPGVIAADMTSNQMQSYNRVPQMWRDLGRNPFFGLFTAFPAESMRNFGWQVKYLGKALHGAHIAESPVVRKILLERAMRQMVGMSVNLRFLSEIGQIAEDATGPELTDQQEEAIRTLAVPEWDRGPMSVTSKSKEEINYVPTGNLEYFQTPRRLMEKLGTLAGHIAAGRSEMVDDASWDLIERVSDDFFQFQQPARGLAETFSNKRIPPSPVSLARDYFQDRTPSQLTANPISTQGALEAVKKGLLPGLLPTPIRQIQDMIEWGTAPDWEKNAGRSPREIVPLKMKTVNSLQQMGIWASKAADEKQNFSNRLKRINEKLISPQEKAREIAKLRDDWNEDLGPRLAKEAALWHSLHTKREVLMASKELGYVTAIPAMRGEVPDFYKVFASAIPGRVRFYVRQTK